VTADTADREHEHVWEWKTLGGWVCGCGVRYSAPQQQEQLIEWLKREVAACKTNLAAVHHPFHRGALSFAERALERAHHLDRAPPAPDAQDAMTGLAERLRTQDNRATGNPLFCVQEEERIYGMDPYYADDMALYIWRAEHDGVYESDVALIDELGAQHFSLAFPLEGTGVIDRHTTRLTIEGHKYERVYYVTRWKFVCAHFTEAAADRYVAENSHNLTNPRIYVTSQYRCWEWIAAVAELRGEPDAG